LYEHFKNQLLEVHQLSVYEKFDVLIKMKPMGGWKPSQLLHAMLEFCPVGMEKHLSFHYLYMQQLPQALPAARGRGGKFRGRGGSRGSQQATAAKAATSSGAGTAGTPAANPTPSDLARMSSGLCFFHWAFADKASECVPPCTWGN
jgi:hypothetical protein